MNESRNRRRVLFAALALGAARIAPAQLALPRVTVIVNNTSAGAKPGIDAFLGGMHDAGHSDGRTYRLEIHYADGDLDKSGALIRAAVGSGPAVLCVAGLTAAKRAHDATKTVPIVMMTGSDLVDAGLASSHARPGGNVTGVADNSDEILVKRFEFTRELLPAARRFALLVNPEFPATPKMEKRLAEAAKRAGVGLRVLTARDGPSLDAALASLGTRGADAILVGGDALFVVNMRSMIEKAGALGMPVVHYWPGAPELGAVLAYIVDFVDNYRRAASYVDRILKGTRPGDLPIHQPTRYELAINVRAARRMGIQVPQSLVARADRVVD